MHHLMEIIEFIAESKHAIGLKSEDGVELLIHVGMDTVQMDGKGFDVKVKANEKVKAGELLLEFDKEANSKSRVFINNTCCNN